MSSQDEPTTHTSTLQRVGMVAIVGRANVGKSTLINGLLREKVSIVSPISQTTRTLIRGIHTEERGQIAFLDTPGVHRAQSSLGKIMNRIARTSIEGVDAILFVLDGSVQPHIEDRGWIRRLLRDGTPVVAVFNKSDRKSDFSQDYILIWQETAIECGGDQDLDWLRISALQGSGTDALMSRLFERMPSGPFLFPEDVLTDFPKKLAIGDIIREKYFLTLKQELPHSIAIWVEDVEEAEERWDVHVVIYVERHSQKGIIIGHKGRLLRRVKRSAEAELSEIYGLRIRLNLFVKIEKNWSKNFWFLKKLGYA